MMTVLTSWDYCKDIDLMLCSQYVEQNLTQQVVNIYQLKYVLRTGKIYTNYLSFFKSCLEKQHNFIMVSLTVNVSSFLCLPILKCWQSLQCILLNVIDASKSFISVSGRDLEFGKYHRSLEVKADKYNNQPNLAI